MTTTREIGLWMDETSDPDDPRWIVSRDAEDATETVRTFDGREEALAFALELAAREGLPAVETGRHGDRRPIA